MSASTTLTERVGEAIGDIVTPLILPIVERNLVPDVILRSGIKQQLAGELAKVKKLSPMEIAETTSAFIKELKTMPIGKISQHSCGCTYMKWNCCN